MDGTMRPIRSPCRMTMLHRIEMDVIQVTLQIPFIGDQALPETSLPDAALALAQPAGTNALTRRDLAGEAGLDQHPARGAIAIAPWQRPHGVHVIGQYHPAQNVERMTLLDLADTVAQEINLLHQQPR